MEEMKKPWLLRAAIGGLAGLLLAVLLRDALFEGGFSMPAFCQPLISWVGVLGAMVITYALFFGLGAAAGIATLPFADSGRELIRQSLLHFIVTAALWSLLLGISIGALDPLLWLVWLGALVLLYLLIWLGRWVGWYAEVAAIREKLGLAPGPSLFHWKETLPYLGFALLLCDALPLVLRLFDAPDVPVLVGLLLPYLLLPVGGFMSGLSLGRRHGFCPLYPLACGVFFIPTVFLLMNYTALPHCFMAAIPALAGNLAGAARHKMKKGAQNHEKTDPPL